MRLTNYSDYALRTLIYLAVRSEQETLATITEIANSYQISRSHLTKIIHQLAQIGYIDSVRGKNGGIQLAKQPKDIILGDVIRQTEPDFYIVPCFPASATTTLDPSLSTAKHAKFKPSQVTLTYPKVDTISLKKQVDIKKIPLVASCSIASTCQLKSVFAEATQAFLRVLDTYTLADIVANDAQLWRILKRQLT